MKIRVRRYKAEELEVGEVVLGVLRLKGEEEREASGNPLEVLLSTAEAEARGRRPDTDYYEVIVEDGETRRVLGEGPRYTWGRRLAFKPERLLRVGIVRRNALNPLVSAPPSEEELEEAELAEKLAGGESVGAYVFKLDDVEWHDVEGEVYVYEGTLALRDPETSNVALVILETESGRRYLRVSRASRKSKSSRTQQ